MLQRFLASILLMAIVALTVFHPFETERKETFSCVSGNAPLGISYSPGQARWLGLDPDTTLEALLDLGIKQVRISAYWNEIENVSGEYDFSSLDHILEILERYDARATIVVGIKGLRWPEFYSPSHIPLAAKNGVVYLTEVQKQALFRFLNETVSRYRENRTVTVWQVENEPLNEAGPRSMKLDYEFLKEEVGLVRTFDDSRPIMLTAWGGRGPEKEWEKLLELGDILGVNLYFRYPPSGGYYGRFASIGDLDEWVIRAENAEKQFVVSELQMEPWDAIPLTEIDSSPSALWWDHLEPRVRAARCLSFGTIYLWGAEWWWREYTRGNVFWWEAATTFFTPR